MSISSSEDRVAPATWINGLDTGCVLKDRYELREVRGVGGFATVYRAKDIAFTVLEVSVAVKLAHDRLSLKSRRRFEREANIAAQINHPNIVRVLDYGVLDGRPWFVMPLLHGHSLQLRRGGHWLEMSRLMLQLCSAVHAMHIGTALSAPGLRTQVLHRDIKPLNCFVTDREHCEPHLTLLDLGLCKFPGVQRLTSVGAAVGTMAYMAPECVVGAVPSTVRSEIYSLGVTFFELLTGELPDPAYRMRGLTDASVQAPDPRMLRPEIPADLAAIVVRAMAPQLSQRFVDVGVMMTAISSVLGRVGVRRTPLTAQREGVAPVIPLHPLPHVELASENTVLRADTVPEPGAAANIAAVPVRAAAVVEAVNNSGAEFSVAVETPAGLVQVARPAAAGPTTGLEIVRVQPVGEGRGRARWFVTAGALVVSIAAGGIILQALRSGPQEGLAATPPAPVGPALRASPVNLPEELQETLPATLPARLQEMLPATLPATSAETLPKIVPQDFPASRDTPPPVEKTPSRPSGAASSTPERVAALQAAILSDAEKAAPALRMCPDAPKNLSAQLQVHRRRGRVLMVDGEPVDEENPWHACVRRELGRIEYPATGTPVKARIRFSLR